MVICLERGADLCMAQLMPLPLTVASVKSRLVLHFWYRRTWIVPEKGPLKRVYWCVVTGMAMNVIANRIAYSINALDDWRCWSRHSLLRCERALLRRGRCVCCVSLTTTKTVLTMVTAVKRILMKTRMIMTSRTMSSCVLMCWQCSSGQSTSVAPDTELIQLRNEGTD